MRINDEIEKKSVRLAKRLASLRIKTPQPAVYHQESISIIAITILYNKNNPCGIILGVVSDHF